MRAWACASCCNTWLMGSAARRKRAGRLSSKSPTRRGSARREASNAIRIVFWASACRPASAWPTAISARMCTFHVLELTAPSVCQRTSQVAGLGLQQAESSQRKIGLGVLIREGREHLDRREHRVAQASRCLALSCAWRSPS